MAKTGCTYKILQGIDAGKEFSSPQELLRHLNMTDALKEATLKPTPEQQQRAESFGYDNPFQAIQSVKKNGGKEYTLSEFDNIPDTEIQAAAEKSTTVKTKKASEAKLADIQARRQSIKDRLSEKLKEERGKLAAGIDPSILSDLVELGATYIEEGVVKAKDFIAKMRSDMKELGIDDSEITDEEITESVFNKVAESLPPSEQGAVYQKNDAYPEGKNETFPPNDKTATGGSQKVKSVIDAYANRSNMPEDLRQGLIDQVGLYYTQLSNEQTFAMGQAIIDSMGMDTAVYEAQNSPDMAPVLRVMILGSAINELKLQQRGASDPVVINELSDKQNTYKDSLDKMVRDYGRAIQLLAPIYQVSGIAAKRKIEKIIEARNKGKEPKVKQAVKEIAEGINDVKITAEDLENASEFDKTSLEARLKEAERRISELEKEPRNAKKTYTRTVSKEQSDKALKQLLGKAYSFPAIDPEVFKNIKIVGTYAMESLIINGQNTYQNFHDLLSRKLRGKYKDAYADLYKDLTKDLEGAETPEQVDDIQSQIDYFEKVSKFVKSPDAAVVRALKAAGYTRTNKNGKESIDWTKVITDRSSVAAAIGSMNKELSKLGLSRGQLATLEKMAEERIKAAIDKRKARYIQKIIEQNEANAAVRALRKANRKSKIDKLVEMSRAGALSQEKIRDIISDELGIVRLDDEAVKRIDELQQLLENAPIGFISAKIEEEIAFITAQYKLDFMWEVIRERYFLRMLSGTATFIKNATGITVMFTRVLQVAARTKGSKKIGPVIANQLKEASVLFRQIMRNGGVDKGIAFLDYTGQKAGIPRVRYAEYQKSRIPVIGRPARIKGKDFNPLNAALDAEKYIGRLLGATDAFVQTIGSGLKQYQYEYLVAVRANPNLSSAEASQLAYNNLYAIELSDAKQTAEKELSAVGVKYNQSDINRRAYEVIERARNPQTVERGEIVAQQDTFKAPDGIGLFSVVAIGLNGMKRAVDNMVQEHGVKDTKMGAALVGVSDVITDAIIPFVGGVANVMEKAIELHAPYGLAKAGLSRLGGAALKGDPEKADFWNDKATDLALRAGFGLMFYGLFKAAMLLSDAMAPDDEDKESFTGLFGEGTERWTEDEVVKKLRRKNTLRMFGSDIPLDFLGTMGIALKNEALVEDLKRYDPRFKDGFQGGEYVSATTAIVGNLFLSSFFESLKRFSGALADPTKDSSSNLFENMLINSLVTRVIPLTNLIRQTGQMINPTASVALTWREKMIKYSGLTAGYGLKPAFDYRGREYDTGDIYAGSADGLVKFLSGSFSKGDEIDIFLMNNGIGVSSPSRVSSNPENNRLLIYNPDGSSRPLTQEEFYEYKKLKADKLNELLEDRFTRLQGKAKSLEARFPEGEAERKLQSYFSSEFNSPAIEYALKEINQKYGDMKMYRRNK